MTLFNRFLHIYPQKLLSISLIAVFLCSITGCEPPSSELVYDERGLYSAELSKNAELLLMSSIDKSAKLVNFADGAELHVWSHSDNNNSDIAHVALSHDGSVAVTSDHTSIIVWDTASGQSTGYYDLTSYIVDLKVNHDGRYALVALGDRSVRLVDLSDGILVWQAEHGGYIESVDISRDGFYAIVGCDDNTATIWDMQNNKRLHVLEDKSRVRFVALSPKNNIALTSTPFNTIKLWDVQTGTVLHELRTVSKAWSILYRPTVHVSSAYFSEDESKLIIGAPPRHVYMWDVSSGELAHKWIIPKHKIWKPTSAIVYASAFNESTQTVHVAASNGYGYSWRINE